MTTKRFSRTAAMGVSLLLLGGGLWLAGARNAAGGPPEPPPDDGVPPGTIASFAGGVCPAGWTIAEPLQGRLLVGVTDADKAEVEVGTPLGDREDRPHDHGYQSKVALTDKAIAAADGANNSGAKAGSYDLAGTTNKQPSGLPFVQVQTCAKK